MSLRIILGPMFAGKTSEILSIVRRYKCVGKKVLVLTSNIDNRYQQTVDAVINHDKDSVPARAISDEDYDNVFEWPDFQDATAIVIDEAQFFGAGLFPFVRRIIGWDKHVIVVGLDSDAEQKPFMNVLSLIALADSVEKRTALCRHCIMPAIFTKARAPRDGRIAVGGGDMYEPVCRQHFD